MVERTIAATTHGRYLVEPASTPSPAGILIGCHGYAEDAEIHLARLRSIPDADTWVRVSVQALHRFYRRRTSDVVASWMTRQDRELMIADNIAYVSAVAAAVIRESASAARVVFAGFSQGASMAYRAACASPSGSAVIAFGGDIPPEVDPAALAALRGVLVGHGLRDKWYTQAKFDHDLQRLDRAGARAEGHSVDAEHEWTAEFSRAVSNFLARLP